nr:MAG TPA: hypothetical protein [Bacteriophage sp.]
MKKTKANNDARSSTTSSRPAPSRSFLRPTSRPMKLSTAKNGS